MDFLISILYEQLLIYGIVAIICAVIIMIYLRRQFKQSQLVKEKIKQAKLDGLHEPVSLHPVVNASSCIKTGACIAACPEKDILGIVDGKATTINASQCIGHGACFHACPTEAISLCIGTAERGVDLPHVDQNFETNIKGIYLAGEIGGMGLIKNAVEQGRQAVESIVNNKMLNTSADYDLIIIGAGPAGISASLTAKKHGLKCLTIEQDSLGGTVYSFPRSKIVMTSPMDLPLYGKVKLYETSKGELLNLWEKVLTINDLSIVEHTKIDSIQKDKGCLKCISNKQASYTTNHVLLAIGRRGSPRKLGVSGEDLEKVAYRLLEPELIYDKNIMIVGGGDSAIEAALALCDKNKVVLSYRSDVFNRIKPKNKEKLNQAIQSNKIQVYYNSQISEIRKDSVVLKDKSTKFIEVDNDLVYVFAGGELPIGFLKSIGLEITKKHGEALLKH